MRLFLVFCFSFLLSGCGALFNSWLQDGTECPVVKPEVLTEYVILPEHLTYPCARPEKIPYGTTWKEYTQIVDRRKSDHNLCADKVDLIKDTNDRYIEKAKEKGP